jgi:hypothetical protein
MWVELNFIQHWEKCRSRWRSGLKRGSAAAPLLELRVRIPPGAWMFVLCVESKDKMAKCRTVRTKKQARMKYKESTREYKRKYRRKHWFQSLVSVVCCQVEVSATGRSLVQRSATNCSVPLCDLEAPRISQSWPTLGSSFKINKIKNSTQIFDSFLALYSQSLLGVS